MGEQLALAAQHHLLARQARALLGDAEPRAAAAAGLLSARARGRSRFRSSCGAD